MGIDRLRTTGRRAILHTPSPITKHLCQNRWCGMDGRAAVASTILAWGADDRAKDRNDQSCRAIAVQRRMWRVVGLLDEAERAYALSKARRLLELEGGERVAVCADPESVAAGTEEVLPAVVSLACHALPDDVARVLDEMLRGSPGPQGL